MEALFTHPLTMAAGAGLVSAPIIIHLINRMRFRRVKWAAMEFLLKAQKRMKRKLIIEQLLLLFLRCLLVFLVGLLLSRFKWFSPPEGEDARATAHVVILDDTPSTADGADADARAGTAFEQAKAQVTDRIAPAAAQANTPQSMDLLLLSDLANPRPVERLNESAVGDLRTFLAPLQPSLVRVSLVDGLRRAKELLDTKPDAEVAKVVHIVSDLRDVDWREDGTALNQLLTQMTAAGTRVHLVDTAPPARKSTDKQPRASDNVGIVELFPRSRTVARGQPLEVELKVRNSGAAELKDVRIEFLLNGRGYPELSARIAALPPDAETTVVATAARGLDRVGTKDNPLDRFNLLTARIAAGTESGGLAADNLRHTVVEVKERLSVLVVEGRPAVRDTPKADGFFVRKLFQESFGGINWVDGAEPDLEKKDLRDFAAVYLLNVPALTAAQTEKLEAYLRGGGGVGVFLGPNVRPGDYTKVLYRNGDGLLPFPLPDAPTKPPTEEQKLKRGFVLAKRVLTRDAAARSHPALAGMYSGGVSTNDIERYFMFASVDQYWPVRRFGKWRDDQSVRELYCLPNDAPMIEFQRPANDLLDKLKVKSSEPKFEKYRALLDPRAQEIRRLTAGDDPLSALAIQYDRLLCDQINDGDPSEPVLREFWGQPELADLKAEFQRERDRVKFGDPLYLVKQFGAGRVAVMTTDAGGVHPDGAWTDWPNGQGNVGWLAVMFELQKYLAGGAADENRAVGSGIAATFDPARYMPVVGRRLVSADPAKVEKGGDIPLDQVDLGEQPLDGAGGGLQFRFADTKKPGVYLVTASQLGDVEKLETTAYVFNLDARREGNLKRVSGDDLAQFAPGVPVHSPDDTAWVNLLKQKRDDFSTRRWLYLLILLVLIAEQAMAVRLSFHTRAEDLAVQSPTAAAAFERGARPAAAAPEPEPAGV